MFAQLTLINEKNMKNKAVRFIHLGVNSKGIETKIHGRLFLKKNFFT
jgi:hypothetical protein